MGTNFNSKNELSKAVKDVMHAQDLINNALDTVEKDHNKQLLQNTLSSVDKALTSTQTSSHGCK